MFFVLTTAGAAAVGASPGTPVTLGSYKLGSGSNYTPTAGDTALHGSLLYTGTPSAPMVEGPTLTRYVITLDRSVGNFNFGEAGLYLPNGTLFALAASNTLITKTQTSGPTVGNQITLDCYVTTIGTNYDIYSELSNSQAPFAVPRLSTVDALPTPDGSAANAFIVASPTADSGNVLATAYESRWSVQGWDVEIATGTVSTVSGTVVNFSAYTNSPSPSDLVISEAGEFLFQMTSGAQIGAVRSVVILSSVAPGVIHVSSAFSSPPDPGDTFVLLKKNKPLQASALQAALTDTNGNPIPSGTQMMTKAQTSAAITSATTSIAAGTLTGLPTAMQDSVTGNASYPRLVDVFGTSIGRIFNA